MRPLAILLLCAVPAAHAAPGADIAPFSGAKPGGALPAGWRPLTLPRVTPPEIALVARAAWGEKLPTAALCYVWDNRHAPGTSGWNPYTDRVRTVVLRSGAPGSWVAEARDLDADFRAAFGPQWALPTPRVTGIAIGNDTDQTGESVTAGFGDFTLGPRS